ncbi:MAG: DUF1667 domain-containing protein [Peptostreptococcaceae bacterium]|nr:DUF1667 domain-containing protein [Peptostreptococcaceae bacterium]MDU4934550.1 DUF1667 domain-containing protein [Peptostreptococcaceae bacterium]
MSAVDTLIKTELTCIVCPMGCHLNVEQSEEGFKVEGNTCKRGEKYAVQELTNPTRVITTTVKLENSYLQLLPVKTEDPIPKGMIFDIMEALDKVRVNAPVKVGDVIVENILDTGVNVISAKTMDVM